MSVKNLLAGSCAAAILAPGFSIAQDTGPVDPFDFEDEIIVQGERQRGLVVGDIEPEVTLDARDVRSYGASSLDELLAALGPLTNSGAGRRGGGGRPAILLNGRRIGSFREIRQFPPEAIERVDILPEEAALKYGFRADQRVVNFVLRERFRALTADLGIGAATDGGRITGAATGNLLRLRNDRRWNVDVDYTRETALFEAERDVVPTGDGLADVVGNVTSVVAGGEIDPALSALAGETVTLAGAPSAAAFGPVGLGEFAAGLANETDQGAYRTLAPRTDKAGVSVSMADALGEAASWTATGALDYTESEDALGLADADLLLPAGGPFSPFSQDVLVARAFLAPGALARRSEQWDAEATFVVNSAPGDWSWSVNGRYGRQDRETVTGRDVDIAGFEAAVAAGTANPFAPLGAGDFSLSETTAENETNAGLLEGVLFGELLDLPAGAVQTSMKVGGGLTRLKSRSSSIPGETRLVRDEANAQLTLDFPLMAEGETPAPIGDLSLGGNVRVDTLSDFDTLTTWGYSATWKPLDGIQLVAGVTHEEGAPTIGQLGDPVIETPNVRLFDFATGETVEDVTRLTGGNTALLNDNRRVIRINLNARPFGDRGVNIFASYTDQRTENAISAFPSLTPDTEAAFPDRFVRDATGRLVSIDARPVNYAETAQRQLRYGLFWSKELTAAPPDLTEAERTRLREIFQRRFQRNRTEGSSGREGGQGQAPAGDGQSQAGQAQGSAQGGGQAGGQGAARGGGPGGGRGGGRGGRFGGGGNGRLQVSAFHTLILEDSVRIDPIGPTLDLLSGDAINAAGGTARHALEVELGYSKQGVGARAEFNWKSGASIRGDGADDLFFEDIGTIDLRLFVDPAQRPRLLIRYPFLIGSRISLEVDNLLNDRQAVRDATGATPLGFQPDLIDPVGRTVTLRFRKIFF